MKNINKIKCHSKLDLESHRFLKRQQGETLNQVQGDVLRYNNAFTLIELLVVVLIIGILAAVALPQYQKAVEKSKATQAITMLTTVYNAAKAYQMASGAWPKSFDELAVDIPWAGTASGIRGAQQGKSNADWSIQIRHDSSSTVRGLSITRLSGTYKGAAFYIYSVPEHPQYSADELLCVELVSGSVDAAYAFKKSKGDYCKKIMKASLVHTLSEGSWNYFRMP